MSRFAKETRVDILQRAAVSLEDTVDKLEVQNRKLIRELQALKQGSMFTSELHKLEEQVSALKQELYGRSSEKSPFASDAPKAKGEQRGHGPTAQPQLPIVEVTHVLDEADTCCPQCGDTLQMWEEQTEVVTEIDVIPEQVLIKRHRKQKYKCACGHIETALGPQRLIKSGRYSAGFGIQVAKDKYQDHIPLERQVRRFNELGLEVRSQTLWDQVYALYTWLKPLPLRIKQELLQQAACVGIDETPWKMLDDKASKNYTLWAVATPEAAYFEAHPTRGADIVKKLLEGYQGKVISDDYAGYNVIAKVLDLGHALCWSHTRRKFVGAQKNEPKRAAAFVGWINEIYHIEHQIPQGATPEDIKAIRSRAGPILKAMRYQLDHIDKVLPESSFGKALAYLRDNWEQLMLFIEHPELPLDNNHTERTIRGPVVGRKNYYGAKSRRGAQVAAAMFTIVETCKLQNINLTEYLKTVLEQAMRKEVPMTPREYRIQRQAK